MIFQPLRFSGAVPFPGFGVSEYVGLLCALASAGLYLHARPRFRGSIPPGVQAAVALAMIVVAIGFPRLATDMAPAAMWILAPGPDATRRLVIESPHSSLPSLRCVVC